MSRNPRRNAARRGITFSVLALASFIAFTGIAAALGAFAVTSDEPPADPAATKRKAVATGHTAGIGDWTLWYSKTSDGGKCVEIQYVDPVQEQVPDEHRASGALPVPGDGVLAGGCGASGAATAATLNTADHTLVYGVAPAEARKVVVRGGGKSAEARLFAPDGVEVKAYAHTLRRTDAQGVDVSARGGDGRQIAAAHAPTPGSRE